MHFHTCIITAPDWFMESVENEDQSKLYSCRLARWMCGFSVWKSESRCCDLNDLIDVVTEEPLKMHEVIFRYAGGQLAVVFFKLILQELRLLDGDCPANVRRLLIEQLSVQQDLII